MITVSTNHWIVMTLFAIIGVGTCAGAVTIGSAIWAAQRRKREALRVLESMQRHALQEGKTWHDHLAAARDRKDTYL